MRNEGMAGEQLIEQIDYGYDAKGRRTLRASVNNYGVGLSDTPMEATYDAGNRMTAVTLEIGGTKKSYSLGYDANGNLQTGYLGDHDLMAVRTEAEKYLMMAALNLVECVAFVGAAKPSR